MKSWVHRVAPPRWLWHYTDEGALRNILWTESLWASSSHWLADKQELHFGRRLFSEVVHQTDWACGPAAARLLRDIADHDRLARHLNGLDLEIFVACLTESGDDLAMWETYTPLRGGDPAFSMGFYPSNPHGWAQTNAPEPNSLFLRRVIYDRPTQMQACRELIECLVPLLDEATEGPEGLAGAAASDFASSLTAGLLEFSAWCKRPEFAIEQEWRLVYQRWGHESALPVETREDGRRYVKLHLPDGAGAHHDRLPVSIIRCGPGVHPSTAATILRDAGGWDVSVATSDWPHPGGSPS